MLQLGNLGRLTVFRCSFHSLLGLNLLRISIGDEAQVMNCRGDARMSNHQRAAVISVQGTDALAHQGDPTFARAKRAPERLQQDQAGSESPSPDSNWILLCERRCKLLELRIAEDLAGILEQRDVQLAELTRV